MTDTVQVAIIAATGAAVPTLALGVMNYLQQRKLSKNMHEVKKQTNHIKDQLMEKTALASHAEGVQDEKIRVAVEQNVPVNTVVAGTPIKDKP
jgi:hypothetical protein